MRGCSVTDGAHDLPTEPVPCVQVDVGWNGSSAIDARQSLSISDVIFFIFDVA